MKITDVKVILLTAPWSGDPYFAPNFVRSTALIQIETDEGVTGLGETIAGYFCPEVVPPLVDYYRPCLLGQDPLQEDRVWREAYHNSLWWGRVGLAVNVLSGIEMTLWNIKGKTAGKPVYELLGGKAHDRLKLYASGGPALWPHERTVEKAHFYLSLGYQALKVSTGVMGHPREAWHAGTLDQVVKEERAKFEALRRAVGDTIDLAIDGHEGPSRTPWIAKWAVAVAQAIEDLNIRFYEEPLRYSDRAGYALLRKLTRIPVAGGESLTMVEEFQNFMDAEALDIVQPDLTVVGGIAVGRQVAQMASSRHLDMILHTGGATGPGLMANYHLAFASPNCQMIEHVIAASDLQRELLVEPLTLKDGYLHAPTAPGLGVELRPETVKRFPFQPGNEERT